MNIPAPNRAPARHDLPWLRRRTTRIAAKDVADVAGGTAGAGVAQPSNANQASPPRDTGLAATRRRQEPVPPHPTADLDLTATQPPSEASPPQPGADLDLSAVSAGGPAPVPTAGEGRRKPPSSDSSLDLSAQPQAASAAQVSQVAPDPTSPRTGEADHLRAARTRDGPPTILTAKSPVVTLTRVQSGVGALTFHAACSESVGDLMLSCAYQLVSGESSVLRHGKDSHGQHLAPAESRRPVIMANGERFGGLTVDLVQNRNLQRLIVYAYSESAAMLRWDGTLVVQTYGGARIEVPLTREPAAGVLVALSLYNVDGEFVLRAEDAMVKGSIREATAAFGFDRIGWLDDHTPLA